MLSTLVTSAEIAVENVRGYRRGFQKPRPDLMSKLEDILGAKLDIEEVSRDVEILALGEEIAAIQKSLIAVGNRLNRLVTA